MYKKVCLVVISVLSLSACQYKTPAEMLQGKWYVASVNANGHEMLDNYMDANTRYFIFEEKGTYRIGLLDSSSAKSWSVQPEENKLILKGGSPFDNIKTWKVRAADEVLYWTDENNRFKITLNRMKKLPEPYIKDAASLVGKWVVDRVTINGHNNTDSYAFPQRWIVLAENGRFYNGNKGGNQTVGFWEPNSSLTKLNFYDNPDLKHPFISFTIAQNSIWYEKQEENQNRPKVRIYFEKEGF